MNDLTYFDIKDVKNTDDNSLGKPIGVANQTLSPLSRDLIVNQMSQMPQQQMPSQVTTPQTIQPQQPVEAMPNMMNQVPQQSQIQQAPQMPQVPQAAPVQQMQEVQQGPQLLENPVMMDPTPVMAQQVITTPIIDPFNPQVPEVDPTLSDFGMTNSTPESKFDIDIPVLGATVSNQTQTAPVLPEPVPEPQMQTVPQFVGTPQFVGAPMNEPVSGNVVETQNKFMVDNVPQQPAPQNNVDVQRIVEEEINRFNMELNNLLKTLSNNLSSKLGNNNLNIIGPLNEAINSGMQKLDNITYSQPQMMPMMDNNHQSTTFLGM